MDWNTVKGNWKQLTGEARKRWGEITDDEFEQIKGQRDKLVGAVQEKYGESKEAAEKQVDEWMNSDTMKKLADNFDDAKSAIQDKLADISGSADAATDETKTS